MHITLASAYADPEFCPLTHRAMRAATLPAVQRAAGADLLPMSAESLKLFAAARRIKGNATRADVMYCLYQGVVNADDTVVDGYDDYYRAEYPNVRDYWSMVFRVTAASMATERSIVAPARNWLARRGLVG